MRDTTSSRRPLWLAGIMAAALSATANTILYVIELATGAIPWTMLSPGRDFPLTLRTVIWVSVAGAVAGTVVYALLQRVMRNPVPAFRIIALLVLAASFIAPLRIPRATAYLALAISLMHTVVAASTVWALTMWALPSKSRQTAR